MFLLGMVERLPELAAVADELDKPADRAKAYEDARDDAAPHPPCRWCARDAVHSTTFGPVCVVQGVKGRTYRRCDQ